MGIGSACVLREFRKDSPESMSHLKQFYKTQEETVSQFELIEQCSELFVTF